MKNMRRVLVILVLALAVATSAQTVETGEEAFTYYFYAGKLSLDRQEYDKALMLFRHCESLRPDDGQTCEYLGMLYSALGQSDKALDYLARAYEADATLWRAYVQAMPREASGQLRKKAIRIVEKATREDARDADTWDVLRQVYTEAGKYRKALKAQDKVDELTGYNAYSAINRYRLQVMRKKTKKAIREIDRYLEMDPTDLRFLLFRLELMEYTKAGWKELESMYERILALDPNNLLVLNNYAYKLALHGGDLKKAERMSQRTIQADSNNPTYLDTYGWILHLQGQDMLARFYLKKAMENLPTDAPADVRREIEEHISEVER